MDLIVPIIESSRNDLNTVQRIVQVLEGLCESPQFVDYCHSSGLVEKLSQVLLR